MMFACERAVAKTPENAKFLSMDSRGLARALTGNTKGAIEDFQAFINMVAQVKPENDAHKEWLEALKSRRQSWVDSLRADENPFTSDELERLRNE